MGLVMRKPAFCICENKDADQLRGNHKADQRLCFRYMDSAIPILSKSEIFKHLAISCGCTARFVSDLVGNPEDRFSHNEAHMSLLTRKSVFSVSNISIVNITVSHIPLLKRSKSTNVLIVCKPYPASLARLLIQDKKSMRLNSNVSSPSNHSTVLQARL